MPSINMIAPRRAEKKRLESTVRKLVIVLLAEAVLITATAGLMVSRIYGTRSLIQDLDVQLTKLQPTVNTIEKYDKDTQALKPKLETLNEAKLTTLKWCRILDNLSASLPEKTWLTRVATVPPQPLAAEMVVNLNGVSASQNLVGETMLRMHDTVVDFNRLDLHFTQKSLVGKTTAVEFEMEAGIKIVEEVQKS
ncbi:MAG: hypothetical protein HYX78_00385 [Armatimonadetes bacterium]|nr:hypothetical protein [Armatimonadota bacterium]